MRKIFLLALTLLVSTFAVGEEGTRPDPRPPKYPSLRIMGFGDFNFFDTKNDSGESVNGFREGQFVLHFVSELSQHFSFFAEVSLTATPDEFKTEVERAFVKYDQSDYFKVGFGRFHTPVSWWNTAYHHGAWLQTTIDRPGPVRFGSEFLPIHFVGIAADGSIPSGGVGLNYIAGVGNGRDDNIARGGDAGDVNNDRALVARLFSRPNKPYGLEGGVSYYSDQIQVEMQQDFDEWIGSAYLVYDRQTPQIIGEYFHVERKGTVTGETFKSDAYYLQVAYRLPVWKERLMPYVRYENSDVSEGEPVFVNEVDRDGGLAGIRIDVANFVAVKVEFRRMSVDSGPRFNGYYAQISYTF